MFGLIFESDCKCNIENNIGDQESEIFVLLEFEDVFPGRYFINPYGVIYDKYTHRFIGTFNNQGYVQNRLVNIKGKYKPYRNHRLVAATFCTRVSELQTDVNHIDGNKSNNYFRNLEWCTHQYNMVHAVQTGLLPPNLGEKNGMSKLTTEQVHQICELMEKRFQYRVILDMVGLEVNKQNLDILTKIRSKHMWKWISDQYNIPTKEERQKQVLYTEEQIHEVCKMIVEGYDNKDIAIYLKSDMSTHSSRHKTYELISRIRRGQTYSNISSQYFQVEGSTTIENNNKCNS